MTTVAASEQLTGLEVAIIGMACRFPGAGEIDSFWHNLRDGVESISTFSDAELIAAGVDPQLLRQPNYVKAGAVLEDVAGFDAAFFDLSPREAELMDPQHRMFLECAVAALEHAGYGLPLERGAIGVYAGANLNTYFFNLYGGLDPTESMGNLHVLTGNDKDYLTTRTSYKLNLHGPSVSVQTACSTSLVAVHLACRAVLSGECTMALAGGISIRVPQQSGYLYEPDGIYSPDGHCRAFDAQGQGTTFGSGVGIVALKRLEDARADGDTIHAVIKGTAINNDGAAKIGYTAPSVSGQADVIAAALTIAEVEADTIGYVEAHGTATPLGDPIEVAALTQAFRLGTSRDGFCALGSVKSNIGHLDTAAGVAGLIKTVQALKHRQIPPSLHFRSPNPQIDFAHTPFYVNTALRDWPSAGAPRRAGISSFGVGGTNAHAIIEEAPAAVPTGPARPWQVLALSAKTPSALRAQTQNLAAYLRQHREVPLADVAYTLQLGRRSFSHRQILICRDHDDALAALEISDPQRLLTAEQRAGNRSVAWLLPGQGTQYPNMGRELYEHEPVFHAQVDHCAELLRPHLGRDLREVLYPQDERRRTNDEGANSSFVLRPSSDPGGLLDQTQYTQPALFVIEYALAQLWLSWGVRPQALLGHSLGEYVAACLAGVFTLEAALALVAARGRLIQQLPGGAMLSVALPEHELQPLLEPQLALAAVNGPALCVVAGPTSSIAALEQQLAASGVQCQRLHTSHAFHSPMLEPILRPFLLELRRVRLRPPQIPIVSNVTGAWLRPDEATDPHYWVRQLQQTVRFADGLQTILREPDSMLLEVGPGQSLISLARQQPAMADRAGAWSLPHARDDQPAGACLLTALGKLWLNGVAVDWASFSAHERRRRVPLPTYPFEHQRYWIEAARPTPSVAHAAESARPPAMQFSLPSWKRSVPPLPAEPGAPQHWLLFMDQCGLGARLADQLEQLGHTVIQVQGGQVFARRTPHSYIIDMRRPEDYVALLADIEAAARLPERIVHLWNVTGDASAAAADDFAQSQDRGFYSLLFLAQALGDRHPLPIQIEVISTHMQHVAGEETLHPEKATSLGPCRVIPQEYPQLTCRSIDVVLPTAPALREQVAGQLLAEFALRPADPIIAYRDGERWLPTFEPVELAATDTWRARLRQRGVYLITGGLGGLGQVFATLLAETVQAQLILVSRSGLPKKADWGTWLSTHDLDDATSRRIRGVQALEQLGANVQVVVANIADLEQTRAALAGAQARFGPIHGVIHAAGLPGGGLIQLKSRSSAAGVLAPKTLGTRNLQLLLDDAPLDFFVLCSSTIALAGGIGQVDYCAANAFLDAFAQANLLRGVATTAINWDEWGAVGMAQAAGQPRRVTLNHPLLNTAVAPSAGREVFLTTLDSSRDWVLAEHRVMGIGTLPGTAYLEMMHAAFVPRAAGQPISIRELRFLQPLMVQDAETASVYTILESAGDTSTCRVVSRAANGGWHEHASAKLSIGSVAAGAPIDVGALTRTLPLVDSARIADVLQASADSPIQWGPRWRSLVAAYLGAQQALAVLELPAPFAQEVATLALHPALLDVAASFACFLIGRTGYLPLAYGAVRAYAPLPARIYSYARWDAELPPDAPTITFAIVIADDAGQRLVEIEDFTLIDERVLSHDQPATVQSQPAQADRYDQIIAQTAGVPGSAARAISPDEGVAAFQRVLCRSKLAQIAISKQPLPALIAQANNPVAPDLSLDGTAGGIPPAHPRRQTQTPYQAPRDEREQLIGEIWQAALGISQVGVHDNFFDLGGHSLLAVQIVERLRNTFHLNVPLSKILQVQTVAGLAQVVAELQAAQEEQEALEILAQLAALSDEEVEMQLSQGA
jgi:acyl transferase domain-containing protein